MLSRSTHAHQIWWSEVVLAETHRRNLLSWSEVIIADTHMKKPVLDESRARPGEMKAYRRNLVCRTLQNVLEENLLEKCLWRIAPFSFSMHTDIPNSNRCTGRGPRRPRAHGAPRARKSGLAPWTRLQNPRRRQRRLQRSGSSPVCCLTTCAQRWRLRAQRAFRAAAPPVSPAAPTSFAAFWVKPGMLPHDVSLALACAGSGSASVPGLSAVREQI